MRYRAPIQSLQRVVDLRELEPQRRQPHALQLFVELGRGEGLVIIDDRWPEGLLTELQRSHWGTFDWYPLELGPEEVRIALSRRAVRLSPLRQLEAFMSADHRRIELLLLQVRGLAAAGRWPQAGRLCGFMETGLLRHMRMEEELLFPLLLDGATPRASIGLVQIEDEHRQMLQELRLIQASAFDAQSDLAPAAAIEREIALLANGLMRSFFSHERNEQQILYTPAELALDSTGSGELVRRLQALR